MNSFEELGLTWLDGLYIILIGLGIFAFTSYIYPPLIKWLKAKGWVGYDIHKKARPATAESGGLGMAIGMALGIIIVGLVYPQIRREMVVFLATIGISAVIGWIDDRIELSSILKIVFMVASGIPIFLLNYVGYIQIDSPILPFIGQIRLTLIYPLVIPLIVAIMTNTVNMMEGYNGEGSGTTSIAAIFIIIAAILSKSAEGLLFGVPVLAAIYAFYRFNKFPAKVFPGDIGTLTIGAALAMLGILGGLEVVMAIAMLTHIFNSFYVLASIKGWIKMKSIKQEINKQDIFVDDDDIIHASQEDDAPLTMPRLICASGAVNEKDLVKYFKILAVVSGIFALLSEIIRQHTMGTPSLVSKSWSYVIVGICVVGYLYLTLRSRRVLVLSFVMILLLMVGLFLFYLIDNFIVDDPLNWLYSFSLAGISIIIAYYVTIYHFWYHIKKMKRVGIN